MKRLLLWVVVLVLVLVPSRGDAQGYKWFYQGCGLFSCHSLFIEAVRYAGSFGGEDFWRARATTTFEVSGEHPGLLEGDFLGGFLYVLYLDAAYLMFSDHYLFKTSDAYVGWFEVDKGWVPSPTGVAEMAYGPAGYVDHDPYGDGLAELDYRDVTLRLVRVSVPEPGTWVLLVTSLAALVPVAWRRRRVA
jgi:hypothetical protein